MTSGAVTADGPACVLADGSQMPMPGPGVWQVPKRARVRERRTLGARPGVCAPAGLRAGDEGS